MNLTDRKPYQPHFSVIGSGDLLTFAIRLSGPSTVKPIGNIPLRAIGEGKSVDFSTVLYCNVIHKV